MSREDRWQGRPWVAFVIRALVFLIPIALSVASAFALQRIIPKPPTWQGAVLWWVGIAAVSTVVLWTADKGARRALPLAALFKLSLVFPDQAPSRYKIARKAGNLRDLEGELELAREQGLAGDRTAAAETILKLVAHLSDHDRATRGHSERVRVFTDMLADELDLDEEQRDRLRWAALLHDVGKLTVHTDVLNKPGKPTEEEWAQLKHHPVAGAEITKPLHEWLGEWSLAVEQHHEKYDGSGYPGGLSGTGISWGARIVAVADAYDTMTAARAYKKPMPAVDARRELATCAGSHFDPVVVRAFLSISLGRLRLAMGPLSWVAQGGPLAQVSGRAIEFGTTVAAAAGAAAVAVVPQMIEQAPAAPEPTVIAAPSETPTPFESPLPELPAPEDEPAVAPPASPEAPAAPDDPAAEPRNVAAPVQQPQPEPAAPVETPPAPGPTVGPTPPPGGLPVPAPSPTPSPTPTPVVIPIATITAAPGDGAQVAPGDTVAVTVRVTMPSDATAPTSSTLTLPLPPGAVLVPGSLTVDGAPISGPDPTASAITLPDLAPGQTVVVSYTLEIVDGVADGTVVIPTAQVRTTTTTVSAGLGSGLTVRLPLRPSVRVNAAPTEVTPGSTTDLTTTVTNPGPGVADAGDLVATTTLSPGLSLVAGTTRVAGVSASESPLTGVSLPRLGPGESVTVAFRARVAATATPATSLAATSRVTGDRVASPPSATATLTVPATTAVTLAAAPTPADGSAVRRGQTLSVSYVVSNGAGANSVATGRTLRAPVPAGTTYVAGSARADGSLVPSGATANPWEAGRAVPSLAPGASHTITFDVTVEPTLGNGSVIGASAQLSGGASPVAAAASWTVDAVSALDATLTASPVAGTVVPGTTITFTSVVTNGSTATARVPGVDVTASVPPELRYERGSATVDGVPVEPLATTSPFADGHGLGALDPGESVRLQWQATLPLPSDDGLVLPTKVTVTSTDPDVAAVTRAITHTSTATTSPRLLLTAPAGIVAVPGQVVPFQIDISNTADGTATVRGLRLTDVLPAGLTYAPGTAKDGSGASIESTPGDDPFDGAGYAVPDLDPGQTATYTFGVTVARPLPDRTVLPVQVDLASPAGTLSSDVDLVVDSAPSLAVDLTVDEPAAVTPGQNLVYTLRVTNDAAATATATGVTVALPTPADTAYVSATDRGGASITGAANPFATARGIGDLTPGQSATVTVTFAVDRPLANGTSIDATATVDTAQTTPITRTVSRTVASSTDLVASSTSTSERVVTPGEIVTLTYRFENRATATATADAGTVTIPVPAGTTYVADTAKVDGTRRGSGPTSPFIDGETVGALPPGSAVTVALDVRIDSPQDDNTLIVVPADLVTTQQSVSASERLRVDSSPLPTITVTAVPDPANAVTPGTEIVYTVSVSNAATATESLRDVRVDGTLPDDGVGAADATSTDLPTGGPQPFAASIAPGATATATFSATVATGPKGILQQIMTVDWEQDRTGVSRVTQHTRDTAPVLDVVVTSTPAETVAVAPGDRITYVATITNDGDAPASNVTVAWPTPARASTVSFTDVPAGTTLAPGASTTATLVVDVTGPNPPSSILSSTISVDADELGTPETTSTNHAISEPTVTVTTEYVGNATAGQLVPGETVTVRTTIANAGPEVDATSIDVAATVPAELAYVAGSAAEDGVAIPDADPTTNPLTEATPYRVTRSIAPGQQVQVTYDATVASPLVNGTSLTATTAADVFELATTLTDEATATVSSSPALTITTVAVPASGTTVSSGQVVTYTVQVRNASTATDAARSVTFTLPTPAGSGYVSGKSFVDRPSTPDGTFEAVADGTGNPFAGGYLLAEPIAPGDNASVRFDVTVTGGSGTSVDLAGDVTVAAPGVGGPATASHQIVGSPVSGLVISEVRFDGVDKEDELVELYNRTGTAIDLSGVVLRSSKDSAQEDHVLLVIPDGTVLPGYHHYLTVNEDGFTYPGAPVGFDRNARRAFADQTFNDDIDRHGGVQVEDPFGVVIDAVGTRAEPPSIDGSLYLEGQGLPPMPAGSSTTYERRHGGVQGNCVDTDANEDDFRHVLDPSDVTYSRLVDGATPCGSAPAPLPASASRVVISQIRADGPAADGLGGNGDEFIELFNADDQPVGIGGWDLVVDGSRVFTFASGVVLEPGQHLLLGGQRDPVRNYYVPPDPTDPTQAADAFYGPAAPLTQALGSPTLSILTLRTDGVAVLRDAADATVDAVSLGSPGGEGPPLVPLVGLTDHSYERLNGGSLGSCVDTQDNRSDFRHRFAAAPRNRTATFTPCPPQPVVGPTGDLDVTMSDSVGGASVSPGQVVTYTVTISNGAGSGFTATGIEVQHQVSRLSGLSASLDGAPIVPVTLLESGVPVPALAPGETSTLTVTGVAPVGGGDPIVSVTEVTADQLIGSVSDLDFKWVGDRAAPNMTVVADPVSGTPVGAGRIITYTMTLANQGTQPMTGVSLNVPLPGDLAYVAGSAVDRTGTAIPGPSFPFVSYPLPDLAPGASFVLSFQGQVLTAAEGTPIVVEPELKAGNVSGEAEDVAQHVFRSASRASAATTPGRRFVPWGEGFDLLGAALSLVWLDIRRRRREQREVLVSTGRRIGAPDRRRQPR